MTCQDTPASGSRAAADAPSDATSLSDGSPSEEPASLAAYVLALVRNQHETNQLMLQILTEIRQTVSQNAVLIEALAEVAREEEEDEPSHYLDGRPIR